MNYNYGDAMDKKFETLKTPPILETALSVSLQRAHFSKDELVRILDGVVANTLSKDDIIERDVVCANLPTGVPNVSQSQRWAGLRVTVEKNLVITILNLKAENAVQVACSILPPYSAWSVFIEKAMPLIRNFCSNALAERVLRVGVRSINRIVVDGLFPLTDYLRAMPPDPLSKGGAFIDGFSYVESFYYPDTKLRAVLIRRAEDVAGRKKSFIIDTDVCALSKEYDLSNPFDGSLLDELHELRDRLFFGSIGTSALEEARK